MTIYKPRAELYLDVPKYGSRTEQVTLNPRLISSKWTRNNHLIADILTATVGWKESGADPRIIRNARAVYSLWDQVQNPSGVPQDFVRFTGLCVRAERRISEEGWIVDMTFHDYTSCFIDMKPLPSAGLPEWTDTLRTAWGKICDNVGYRDPETGKILSNVAALKDRMVFRPEATGDLILGSACPPRFHAISKPQPPGFHTANAWQVWQYLCGMLGLVSFIDRDQIIVQNTTEQYALGDTRPAPTMIYGQNILEFEEDADSTQNAKGVILKSFDHLQGRVIESAWPPPGDESLKVTRAVARRADKEGRAPTVNELPGDYEEFEQHQITDQAALDERAKWCYEEYKRQNMSGRIKTAEMYVDNEFGDKVDLLDVRANEPILVRLSVENLDLLKTLGSEEQQIQYLVDRCGYDPNLARLVVQNMSAVQIASPLFHMTSLDVDFGDEKFEIDIKFHNLITLPDTTVQNV